LARFDGTTGKTIQNSSATLTDAGALTTASLSLTTDLSVDNGGSGRGTATAYAVICGGITATASHQSVSGLGSANQVLTSNGAGALPTWQNAAAGGLTWNEETGTSVSMAVANAYILNNAALVTATLPATAAVGDLIRVTIKGAGLGKIAQNAGQTIHFGNMDSTTGAGGDITATAQWDAVELVCVTANTDFQVISSMGSWTVT
jgi:hypothetical protein